jgi:hypothetical protein
MILSTAAVARAAPPPGSPEMVAAQGHWQAGKAYFEKGQLARALREFREAARDVDLPALDYNIAKTYDRLGDAARAVDYYRRFIDRAAATGAATLEDRREIAERMTALQKQIGRISVTSKVPGTSFLIDEEAIAPEKLAAGMTITVGRHRILASKEGYLTGTLEVNVAPGDAQVVEVNPISQQAIIVQQTTPPPSVVAPPLPQPEEKRKSRGWIAGVVMGVLAVGAGVAIALTLLLSRTDVEAPLRGNVDPGIVTIP